MEKACVKYLLQSSLVFIFVGLSSLAQTQTQPVNPHGTSHAPAVTQFESGQLPAPNGPGDQTAPAKQISAEEAEKAFYIFASKIDSSQIETLPLQNNGRVKPLDSLARESNLYILGSRSKWGLDPVQFYLGLIVFEFNSSLQIIEMRDADLREALGFKRERRFYSVADLDSLGLDERVRPVLEKEQANKRSLIPSEKALLELSNQYNLARGMIGGGHFLSSVDFSGINSSGTNGQAALDSTETEIIKLAKQYLTALAQNQPSSEFAHQLMAKATIQKTPDLFTHYMQTLQLEVFHNHLHIFLWAAFFYFLCGVCFLVKPVREKLSPRLAWSLYALPLILHMTGFAIRVYITGFAPVTNMYGTMLWVALGVALFSSVLLALYKNFILVGFLLLGSALVLILTEGFPLVLSPDMDPIVAVLRSNYWLTIHVLTITISYAAFTICMLIGNFALVRTILGQATPEFLKTSAHSAYRMTQLGVLLLTAGIILGGIWADYSWGRFWGWDPKETWALIADVGFIAILHARYAGWLDAFGCLAASTVAYLLVIMAWYGVNFVLAAGLHSYGFSSGGTAVVIGFISLQLLILTVALISRLRRPTKVS
jgi:ABC-type transport system involved in cytochrome c biogenesis permease subunit